MSIFINARPKKYHFNFDNRYFSMLVVISEINRDWLPLSVADERLQTSWGCEKQTKSTMRNETGVLSTTIPSLLVMEAKE